MIKTVIEGENPEQFIRYNDPNVEKIEDNEEDKITDIIESFRSMQEKNFKKYQYGLRGTHTKTQGIVKGTLTIPSDLPPYLSQGLFKHPGKYPVILRYANEPTQVEDDHAPGPRGIGMKVFNVPGSKLRQEENSTTQDFFFNNVPVLELTNATVCRDIQLLRDKYFDDPEGLKEVLKQRDDAKVQLARYELPNTNIMGQDMFSQSAYRYGDYIVKYALFPIADEQLKTKDQHVKSTDSPSILSEWIQDYFHDYSAQYEFRVQFCSDLNLQPVEDTSIEWSQLLAPFHTVATFDIPRQETLDTNICQWWHDDIRLSPWTGLEEHRPLGSINRVRKRLYNASAAYRAKKNDQQVTFPQNLNETPPQTPL